MCQDFVVLFRSQSYKSITSWEQFQNEQLINCNNKNKPIKKEMEKKTTMTSPHKTMTSYSQFYESVF